METGDCLPTVDVFCRQFNVSVHTIWAALRRLRGDGYIDMKNGRMTRVIYKQTEQERRDFIIDYFSCRWSAYIDIYQATELMYVPFLIEGFRRMNGQEIAYIAGLSEDADVDGLILFYSFTLQKIENPLLMNLFWETSLFLGYPFAESGFRPYGFDPETGRQQLKQIVILVKEGSWVTLRNTLIQQQRGIISKLIENLEPQVRMVPKEGQTAFIWRVYNGHPQVCFDLASRLLHEMYMGEYSKTEFLPSYEKLAEKWGVSVSTARRTVSMLNQAGATQSINGKGTLILEVGKGGRQPDFTSPVLRRSISCLVQALELLRYTCEEVSRHFFQHLLPEERAELTERFEEYQSSGRCRFSIHTYLYFIAKYSRIQAIRQIYGTIYGLLLWGYPLKVSSEAEAKMIEMETCFTASMIRFMKDNDAERCAATVREYIREQLPAGIKYLAQHGIAEEDLRIPAPIRLFIAEE